MELAFEKLKEYLLTDATQEFIRNNESGDEKKLLLKSKTVENVPTKIIVEQILGRRKAKEKLPTFYSHNNIIYPPSISVEQSSSEQAANFKASLVSSLKEGSLHKLGADLTGGFGVDSFFLCKAFEKFNYVERNESLLQIVKHNYHTVGVTNVVFDSVTAEEFLKSSNDHFDFIFIDPSRRTQNNKKVYAFHECDPDIVSLQAQLFQRTNLLLIKASPLLDIQQALKELRFVKTVYVLSIQNECKEVLFLCENKFEQEPVIEAINFVGESTSSYTFKFSQEREIQSEYSDPKTYLYEPNASILKAGAFKSIAKSFALEKIHTNTHLYTSDSLVQDFPGRIFKIISHNKPDQKSLAEFLPEGKANITTRNYPLSVEELKKKTKLKDGGHRFVIGFSGKIKKFLVVAERLK